jgi:type IV pilus assembly protein PilW
VFAGGSAGANAVPVKVKLGVPGDTVDWRCYRYRVFETIVPLRNFVWRP